MLPAQPNRGLIDGIRCLQVLASMKGVSGVPETPSSRVRPGCARDRRPSGAIRRERWPVESPDRAPGIPSSDADREAVGPQSVFPALSPLPRLPLPPTSPWAWLNCPRASSHLHTRSAPSPMSMEKSRLRFCQSIPARGRLRNRDPRRVRRTRRAPVNVN